VSTGAGEGLAPPAPGAQRAETSAPGSPPVRQCHPTRGQTDGQKDGRSPKSSTWVGSVPEQEAGAEPESNHCHQGENNPAVRTSETKKDASLGCFFSINFFFFYEKRSHGVLQQTECQKNRFKQNINKTKQKKKRQKPGSPFLSIV